MMTTDDGLNVSNKVAKEINTITSSCNVDFGVKLHQPIDHHQSFPSGTPMMVPHVNHHRPMFDNGPTSSCDINKSLMSYISDRIYRVAAGGATSGGVVGVRNFQSFDISETSISTAASAFRSPGGNMAASLGFPFTNTQWKELERQAMIYNYITASVPVPPQFLIPTPRMGNGLNVRFSNGADLEPGRCRRTDGKKWRCSRDVAPDQKYCERHMHRGRPRSRKHVELNASSNNNKKNRHNPAICPEAPVTVAISKPAINNSNSGSASHDQFFGSMPMPQPYIQAPVFVNKTSEKTSTFDVNGAYGSTFKEPRSLDWMLKGEAGPIAKNDQQWPHLVHKEIELATEGSFNSASVLKQHYQGESLNLNSFGNFNAREDQQSNQYSLFLDEAPRSFIDAWSNDAISRNTSSVSSDGKLHLSPLSLSMGSNRSTDDEMGQIRMGLGLIKSDRNEEGGNTSSTPGGPLAEVLQLRTSNTTGTNQSSSVMENGDSISPPATTVSSPSGVLQKTLASFSDSSGNSSPTLASSRTKPETAMLWLNQG
uniref:Growth-regulating factor n=1 Tax=Populus alba x Populus glandulosa TaxID=153471 RepID=A0A866W1A5_9ROSI|nr:growth-regulating factor 7a [Populus alba x Populus glandulosa]